MNETDRPSTRRRATTTVDARIIHRVVRHPLPRARSEPIRSRAVTSRARSTPSPSSDRGRHRYARISLGSVGRPRCLNRGRPSRETSETTRDERRRRDRDRVDPRPRPPRRDETRDGRRGRSRSIDRDRARSSHSFIHLTRSNESFRSYVPSGRRWRERRACARARVSPRAGSIRCSTPRRPWCVVCVECERRCDAKTRPPRPCVPPRASSSVGAVFTTTAVYDSSKSRAPYPHRDRSIDRSDRDACGGRSHIWKRRRILVLRGA